MHINTFSPIAFGQGNPPKRSKADIPLNNETINTNQINAIRNTLIAGTLGLLTSCTNTAPHSTSSIPPEKTILPANIYYQISRESLGNGKYIDTVDGKKYTVQYTKDGYSVTCPDGSIKSFNYAKRCTTMTEEQLDEMIGFLEKQNGLVLADLATEASELRYFWGPFVKGYYSSTLERINTGTDAFHHELGHAIDFHKTKDHNSRNFSINKDFNKTAEKEHTALMEKLKTTKDKDLLPRGDMNSNSEIFAECAGLIMSGGNYDRNRGLFEEHFPQTLILARKYVDEAHTLPQNIRNPFVSHNTKLSDGKIECIITDHQGRKIKKSVYDPQKWPAIADPYEGKFNSKGQIIQEVLTEPNKYTLKVRKYTHRKLNPETGEVISETTKKGTLTPKHL